jgi:hypothetical protein
MKGRMIMHSELIRRGERATVAKFMLEPGRKEEIHDKN